MSRKKKLAMGLAKKQRQKERNTMFHEFAKTNRELIRLRNQQYYHHNKKKGMV